MAPPLGIALRLRRVQRALELGEAPCLAITGVDAHSNTGSSELAKWLISGGSGHRVLELEPLPPELDDLIILITATTLHLAIKRPTWEAIRDELLAFAANVYVYPLDVPEPSGDSSDYAPLMAAKAAALEQMLPPAEELLLVGAAA